MKYFRKLFISLGIVLLAVFCGTIVLFNWSVTGWKALTVQTGSMQPTISTGSLVLVHRVPESSLKAGDVITYVNQQQKNTLTTHRIVETKKINGVVPAFVTKGDANQAADMPIVGGLVQGKVMWHVPYVGAWLDFAKKPIVLLPLVYIPALFITIDEVRRLGTYYKKAKKYDIRQLVRGREPKETQSLILNPKYSGVLVAIVFAMTIPVHALLTSNTVSLANNNITVAGNQNGGQHVLFKNINFRCSEDNSRTANKRPRIVIFNPTDANINAAGWKIKDNSGAIITLPNNQIIKKHKKYVFTPWLSSGLQYAGDRLVLVDAAGNTIDQLSWGTDTTQFNPSIAGVTAGTKLKRKPPQNDTDKATDWKVKQHSCDRDDHDDGDHDGHHDHDNDYDDDDDNDQHCDDRNESDRTRKVGMYHMQEHDR